MADSASSPATLEPKPESIAPSSQPAQPDPVPHSVSPSPSPAPVAAQNPNPSLLSTPLPPPPQLHPTVSYAVAPPQILPPAPASFRPLHPQAPQFSPLPLHSGAPNLSYQNPSVQPPGVSSTSAVAAGAPGGSVAVPMSVPPPMQPMMSYQAQPGQPAIPSFRAYAPPMPNGYAAVPAPQGTVPPAVS